jgi:PRC-barrel domain protein
MAEPAATGSAPPPLKEALGWIGFRVDDMNGTRLARVLDIYVDADDENPVWVLVKLGRFGKVTAVPFADCADGPGRIWVAHGRKVVRGAPAVDGGKPLNREDEVALCEHYFIGPDRGRHAQIETRTYETVTAKPVEGTAEGEG